MNYSTDVTTRLAQINLVDVLGDFLDARSYLVAQLSVGPQDEEGEETPGLMTRDAALRLIDESCGALRCGGEAATPDHALCMRYLGDTHKKLMEGSAWLTKLIGDSACRRAMDSLMEEMLQSPTYALAGAFTW
jgi:hypothetical protein